ncbi:MAG: 2OG-Fe(II) oxygenase [Pseudomonadota bacterium]
MAVLPDEKQLETLIDSLCQALTEQGYAILDNVLPQELAAALRDEALQLKDENLLRAGTGRKQDHHLDKTVRADSISWLEPKSIPCRTYLEFMEVLRKGINRNLYLGLFEYECHYARYEPGAFYKTHLDAFGGKRNRILSTTYYLNPEWAAENKGELVLYTPDAKQIIATVLPTFNRMVIFLSERFPHEVLPTRQVRYSMAGWFRVSERK